MKIALLLAALAGTGVAVWQWCPCDCTATGAQAQAAPPPAFPVAQAAVAQAAVPQVAAAPAEDADDDADDGDDEVAIALDAVPSKALEAAKGAVPGITFSAAERETEDGRVVYCLEGTKDGVRFEVEVTAEGEVVEVESGDDD